MNLISYIVNKKREKFLLENVGINDRVLDIGCGDGRFVRLLRKYFINAIGIDPNNKGLYTIKGSVYNLPFKDNQFDLLVLFEVIEHVDKRAYKEMRRVLKSNGKIIITSPKPKWNWLIEILSKYGIISPLITPHVNLVEPSDIPFKKIYSSNFYIIGWKGLFRNIKKKESGA